MSKIILAIGCHPDDIEFMMSGTLFLLKERGCEIHYMNIANGNCGTAEYGNKQIISIRKREAQNAAKYLGANYHNSLVNDIEVFYNDELIRKTTAIIRKVKPDIMLIPSLEDYMEDHMNTARIAVTAAFCRGMLNYYSIPKTPLILKDVVLYHALPYGLRDGMKNLIKPEFCADITSVIDKKEKMLAFHQSQKAWLDKSQGLDSYLKIMREMSREVGRISGRFKYAEGWRMHSDLGFSSRKNDPLKNILCIKDNMRTPKSVPAK